MLHVYVNAMQADHVSAMILRLGLHPRESLVAVEEVGGGDSDTARDRDLNAGELDALKMLERLGVHLNQIEDDMLLFNVCEWMRHRLTGQSPVRVPRSCLADIFVRFEGVKAHSSMCGIFVASTGYVELVVDDFNRFGPGFFRLKKTARVENGRRCNHEVVKPLVLSERNLVDVNIHLTSRDGVCIEISPASPLCHLMTSTGSPRKDLSRDGYPRLGYRTTVKVLFGKSLPQAQAEEYARELLASLFYELDVRNGVRLRTRRWPDQRAAKRVVGSPNDKVIRYPEMKVNPEISSLFGFAGTAVDNPSLAFLSYYQILEYYLPLAVKRKALREIGKEVSDPLFDKASPESLMRVLSLGERSFHGTEASQMRTLVEECVRAGKMEEFLSGSEESEHFGKRGPIKGVGVVSAGNRQQSLATQVADRVYAIRNRIVHAKDDPKYDDAPPILPQSAEADALWPDIYLMRFLASEVILDVQSGI
ncbi:hypothetical protein SLNHY_4114 [Streptomyces albus]|nr:hypothetical protein SLNHY_4114 [Streptomyces albus]